MCPSVTWAFPCVITNGLVKSGVKALKPPAYTNNRVEDHKLSGAASSGCNITIRDNKKK